MDEQRPFLNRESFVIRLWQRETDAVTWLGEVQHVGSGETAVIRSLSELAGVVERLMGKTAVTHPTAPIQNKTNQKNKN